MVTALDVLTHSFSITYPHLWATHQNVLPEKQLVFTQLCSPEFLSQSFSSFKSLAHAPDGWDYSLSNGAIVSDQTAKFPPRQFLNHYSLSTKFFVTIYKPVLSLQLVIDLSVHGTVAGQGWYSYKGQFCETKSAVSKWEDNQMLYAWKYWAFLILFPFKNIFHM